jgi:DNA-binding beta-propeller fold protein YncE
MVGSLGYWLDQQAVERGSQPLYYYGLMVSLYEYLPLTGFGAAALYVLKRGLAKTQTLAHVFVPLLFFWTALSWLIYSLAGEKMPWMTTHIAVPMILASGWVVGKLIESADWRAILRRGGWAVVLLTPLAFAASVQIISPWLKALKPFSGHGLGQLNATMQFSAAFLVLPVLLGVLYRIWQRVGGATFRQALAILALGFLAIFTIRTAWALSFINADYASEFLVFAHATPDVRAVMAQLEDISLRTADERTLDVAYTADGSYPFMWYLRNYRNAAQLPNPPNRAALDRSVVIAGDKEWPGVEPYLGEKYACNHYNFMWWPMQDYFGLTWDRIRYALTNPHMRGAVWDIFLRRDYHAYEQATGKTVRLSEWPLRAGFRFCVRRDVLAKMWGQSAAQVEFAYTPDSPLPGYVAPEQLAVAELEIKSLGSSGDFNGPHGLALDADGFLYVADTDNHRIVKLSPTGELVDTWDSTWWRGRQNWQPNGCLDEAGRPLALGEGEFCEPWGVAVGPGGRVYVADTWNHRVQVFNPDGQFLNQVGSFGQSGADVRAVPGQFYGPRDVAVDREGRVYVGDTGNKRVQVFDAGLSYLYAFGGPGIVEGRMDEPVGLAIGPDDLLYVADTWNRRVLVFTLQGESVRQWPVAGWQGQSPFNKPYLAADSAGRVYASDPQGLHIFVFDEQGAALLALKGSGEDALQLPIGLALDARDYLWVSDAANHRLLRFPALDFGQPGKKSEIEP